MKKPTGRKPMRIGAVLLTEVAYRHKGQIQGYRVEATWRDPARRKKWLPNWRAAEEFAREQDAALEAAKGNTGHTFAQAADGWLKRQERRVTAKDPTLGPQALHRYTRHVGMARAALGRLPLHEGDVLRRHIRKWLDELGQQYAATTLPQLRGIVGQVLDYAQDEGMIAINPLKVTPIKLSGTTKKRADIPDRSDMEVLRRYIQGPRPRNTPYLTWSYVRVAIVLAASCGLRIAEVCGLRWDRIDPDTAEVEITDVITSFPDVRVRPRPKSDAGFRKVPLDLEAQQMLNEHAVLYKERFGKLVGHVIRSDRMHRDGFRPNPGWIRPTSLSGDFIQVMRNAGLVKADGKPKFSFHALRHWFASYSMKHTSGDYHRVARWMGHKNASLTLDVYGHCVDDFEGRQKFLQMPSWLTPPLDADALTAPSRPALLPAPDSAMSAIAAPVECPVPVPDFAEDWLRVFVLELFRSGGSMRDALRPTGKTGTQIRYELRRCGMPRVDELRAMASSEVINGEEPARPPVLKESCPIDLPAGAAAWVEPYILALNKGVLHQVACRMVHKDPPVVVAELRRLKVIKGRENAGTLRRRLLHERILDLSGQGYQDADVARMLGLRDRHTVQKVRRTRLKLVGSKPLKDKEKAPVRHKPDARPGHKNQLKFL